MPKEPVENKPKKSAGIDAVLKSIAKITGIEGSLKKGFSREAEYLSFGYPDVDEASGGGGIEKGKLVEIFGQPSGGKSYLSLKLISSCQKTGMPCCLVDAEQAFDSVWAQKNGVDVKELYVFRESVGAETILDAVVKLCESRSFGLVVIDSTAALIPQKSLDGSIGDQDYALLARAMSKACPKIKNACGATGTTCVFLNQIREKMNVMFGSPDTTPGGNALKFFADQRIQVTPGQIIRLKDGKKGDDGKDEKGTVVGRKSYVKFVKNKTAPPFGECVIEIIFNEAALNPVVMLCNAARNYKLIGTRNGIFQIKKEVIGEKKNLDTGATTVAEFADYIVKNNLVVTLIDSYVKAVEEAVEEGDDEKVDESILRMKEDASLIKSPLDGKTLNVEILADRPEGGDETGPSETA